MALRREESSLRTWLGTLEGKLSKGDCVAGGRRSNWVVLATVFA